ncbi:MAG: nitrous oxide reductase family maturation protein NosD [Promethearchaeota archaeon]
MTRISKIKLRILLIPLVILLLTSLHAFNISLKLTYDFNSDLEQFQVKNLKNSDFWVMGPLHIKDSGIGGDYTWDEAVLEDWCNGSGTINFPYVIENITIDAGGNSNGILIENSIGKHFTIRNCTIRNAGGPFDANAGIELISSTNGTIINNKLYDNVKTGIYLQTDSNYNTIENNYVFNTSHTGIRIYESSHNLVFNNTIMKGGWYESYPWVTGIYIDHDSYNNRVLKNNLTDLNYGIELTNAAYYNIITQNYINNISSIGLRISLDSNNNTVKFNRIFNSTSYGIRVIGNGTQIYGNILMDNGENAENWGSYNHWDNGTIGNYWDDYGGVDDNDDGIGDSSYSIAGIGTDFDNYPIWDDGFNGTAIHIDDTGINSYNWNFASTRTWCTGSGTFLNPYIIEGITIDTPTNGDGIVIENSNVYFIIKDCIIHDGSDMGIQFNNVNNSKIIGNTIYNFWRAIWVDYGHNNQILENYLYSNGGLGILLYQSTYNLIQNNNISDGDYQGIYIQGSSHFNNITNNHCTEISGVSGWGIGIIVQGSDDCIVLNNYLNLNTYGVKIRNGADRNIVKSNILENNQYGAYIETTTQPCYDNQFYNNTFNNPIGINAIDNGLNSDWNFTSLGNFWDDYSFYDHDDDGVGDLPYTISGSAGSEDYHPIWNDGPNPIPIISINSPFADSIFQFDAPTFNISLTDVDLDHSWYTIASSPTKHFYTPQNGINIVPIEEVVWDGLSEGDIIIHFYVNDTQGQMDDFEITIIKQIPSPQGIPFGNFYLILLGISICSLILFVVKKKITV